MRQGNKYIVSFNHADKTVHTFTARYLGENDMMNCHYFDMRPQFGTVTMRKSDIVSTVRVPSNTPNKF